MLFWRRRDIERAKEAADQAREDRGAVDELTEELKSRGKENKFAPLLIEAFRGDG